MTHSGTFAITLYDLLAHNLADGAERVAIEHGDERLTYADLHARVERLAQWLISVGVERGDRVAIHLYKSVDEVVAMFAVVRLGAVIVNVNYQWTPQQLAYVAADAGTEVLIADARRAKELVAVGLPAPVRAVLVKGEAPDHTAMTAWSGIDAGGPLCAPPLVDTDLAAILYTSGSTGAPKGVMLSHQNLVLGARSVSRYLGLRPDDRLLSLLPFSFDYGLNQLLDSCLLGATLVLQPVTMPSVIAKTLVDKAVTVFAAVPPTWIQLVRYLREVPTALPALRVVTNSGGKIPAGVLDAMPKVFPGAAIVLMYGLTEAFRSTYLPPALFHSKKGAIGRAIPNAQTYVISSGRVCGPGDEGELVHRGSLISMGYWNQPEATAQKIKPCPELRALIGDEKVVYSGDLVRIDDDGDYWFVGRMDSMIKCSGFRLSPTEVEEVAHQSGLVASAVAFGVEDELLGQVVHVVASPPEGQGLDIEALDAYCKSHMPHYMQPRRIHSWEGEMPKTASGKIDRPTVIKECHARIA